MKKVSERLQSFGILSSQPGLSSKSSRRSSSHHAGVKRGYLLSNVNLDVGGFLNSTNYHKTASEGFPLKGFRNYQGSYFLVLRLNATFRGAQRKVFCTNIARFVSSGN